MDKAIVQRLLRNAQGCVFVKAHLSLVTYEAAEMVASKAAESSDAKIVQLVDSSKGGFSATFTLLPEQIEKLESCDGIDTVSRLLSRQAERRFAASPEV